MPKLKDTLPIEAYFELAKLTAEGLAELQWAFHDLMWENLNAADTFPMGSPRRHTALGRAAAFERAFADVDVLDAKIDEIRNKYMFEDEKKCKS